MFFTLFHICLIVALVLCVFAFSRSWKLAGIGAGIGLLVAFLWVAFPFSAERWQVASLLEKRFLAQNFLNLHSYQGRSLSEIEKIFGSEKLQDEWQYYVKSNQSITGVSGVTIEFTGGNVTAVDTWFSKPIPGTATYSSDNWKDADQSNRSTMISDLIASKILIGKSKKEVY